MFECIFEKQGMIKSNIGIAGNVVDDTEDITIIAPSLLCEDYYTKEECLAHAGCYWWGDPPSCHGEAPPEEFPWLIIAIVAGVSIIGVIAFAMLRK